MPVRYETHRVVRDNISGNRLVPKPAEIARIIDSNVFQRLRLIKQTGFTSYVFPGAEHTRFAHSLGVYATSITAFERLRSSAAEQDLGLTLPGLSFDGDKLKDSFCIAALCHDIGHTAYSHALEGDLLPAEFNRQHENATCWLIENDRQLRSAINGVADIEAITWLIRREHANAALNSLISGAFDVDRCDYIVRDSKMTGVEYGHFDLNWLFRCMSTTLNSAGQPIIVFDGTRGVDALRQFLSARRYMYRQVYFHKSARAAELLLRSILTRLRNGVCQFIEQQMPTCLRHLTRGEKPSISDFLRTTDVEVMYFVRIAAQDENSDTVLRYLAKSLLNRRLPKVILDSSKSVEEAKQLAGFGHRPLPLEPPAAGLSGIEQIREEVRSKLKRLADPNVPHEIADYVVKLDEVSFDTSLDESYKFRFGDKYVSLAEVDEKVIGFNVLGLAEEFTIRRLFVPQEAKDVRP
jgi:uncharacterized protein